MATTMRGGGARDADRAAVIAADAEGARQPRRDHAGTVDLRAVGHEAEPVIVVDDATGAWRDLVDFAATRSRFEPAAAVGSHYPGLLGTAPKAYVDGLVALAIGLVSTHIRPVRPLRARGNFSLVMTPGDALSPEQRIPHVDAADRMQFAIVHYLAAHDHGGTGFFRHRATGFETIDQDRLPTYRRALDADLARDETHGYAGRVGVGTLFTCIGAVDPRPDRLVLYRAALLHSGLVDAVPDGASDPRRGRLTGNLFLQCRPA